MLTLNSPQVVQETVLRWKRENKIAFVPTMGCLHEGHLALVRKAKIFGQKVVVSLFVNPLQFGPNEDFEKYPRTFEADSSALDDLGVDLLFAPTRDSLYPEGFCTTVQIGLLSDFLCGKFRPGHFAGVATVVLKFFQIVQPDFAVFGEKDYQQLRIVEQMTADLNLPITILPHETLREADGLALSSRNRYLSADDRRRAVAIPQCLTTLAERARRDPSVTVKELTEAARQSLTQAELEIEYAEIASSRNLRPAPGDQKVGSLFSPRLFLAVRAGATRLIDNASLANEGDKR